MERQKEFKSRIEKIRVEMAKESIDLLFVFGDEYRKENLRFASDFWPIYERGGILIPSKGEPVVLVAPEGEAIVKEMSIWQDIRLMPQFECAYVAEKIDYPLAKYITFNDLFKELGERCKIEKVGFVGIDIMPKALYDSFSDSFSAYEIVDAVDIFNKLRITKSEYEVNCFRKAHEIADEAYKAIIKACVPGVTELQASAAGEAVARASGSEAIAFCTLMSGQRTERVVARSSEKVIENGDMIMVSLAIQYKGYIATVAFPFVVGIPTQKQIELIDVLIESSEIGFPYLKAGEPQGNYVKAIKDFFESRDCTQYDLYPPLHGAGLAEAELPYPNEKTQKPFEENCIINTDISLFRHPGGSNRIEEGILITKDGPKRFSKLVPKLLEDWKEIRAIRLSTIQ